MKARFVFAVAVVAAISSVAAPARAQGVEAEVEKDNRLALEYLDLGDAKAAVVALESSLAKIKNAKLLESPIAVKTHVLLGGAYAMAKNMDGAKIQFEAALSIDKDAQLPGRFDLLAGKDFEAIRARLHPVIECDTLKALHHQRIESTRAGKALDVEVMVGSGLSPAAVKLHFRPLSSAKFSAVTMKAKSGCTVAAQIPLEVVKAPGFDYYVSAYNDADKIIAARGHAGSPFRVEVEAVAPKRPKASFGGEDDPGNLGPAKVNKSSGCAGCQAGGSSGTGLLFVAVFGLLAVSRRRR